MLTTQLHGSVFCLLLCPDKMWDLYTYRKNHGTEQLWGASLDAPPLAHTVLSAQLLPFCPVVYPLSSFPGGQLLIWLTDWLGGWVAGWLAGWLTGWWVGGWVTGWIDGWMAKQVGGWVAGWVSGWVGGWLAGCLGGWIAGWLGGWVPGWLAG